MRYLWRAAPYLACTLITGDLDFKPLVTALVEMGVNVQLLYPKDETNDDLKAAADSAEEVTIDIVRDWSSDAQRQLLPFGGLDLQSTGFEPYAKLFVWRDELWRLFCYKWLWPF
jgi:hypothetical protein